MRYRLNVKKWLKYTTKKSATRSFLFLLLVSSFRIDTFGDKKNAYVCYTCKCCNYFDCGWFGPLADQPVYSNGL